MPGADVARRLDTFLQEVEDAHRRHPHGVKLLMGLSIVQQDASAAAVAQVHDYRDALVSWAQESVSAVFGLSERPEVSYRDSCRKPRRSCRG
ncbi:hypothetical protein GCM10023335_55640 [Streptomyces siamensis]|uniref:Uncharacterized protein n=1 Tax=Streptomyces siamensis TaxID=1274986 RepID=A0ABP9J980_9ACTN